MNKFKKIISVMSLCTLTVSSCFTSPFLCFDNIYAADVSNNEYNDTIMINLNELYENSLLNNNEASNAVTTAPVTSTVKASAVTTAAKKTTAKVVTTTSVKTPDVKTSTTAVKKDEPVFNVFDVYDEYQMHINTTTTTTTATTTITTTTTTTTTTKISRGIDVSQWQGNITWTSVKKSNIDFAMIRSGYGNLTSQEDPKFKDNIKAAQAQGIPCGTYWYSYATTVEDAYREAEACYQVIKNYKFEYPVVFDIEENRQRDLSTATVSGIIEAFCSTLESKGYYVCLYSYANFLNTKVYESTLNRYDIWVAHYTTNKKPDFNGKYGMWQYSSTGKVNGISGDVDLNYGYKNYPAIIKSKKINGFK